MPANDRWDLIRRLKVNLSGGFYVKIVCSYYLTSYDIIII